jgi:hypothetical protein
MKMRLLGTLAVSVVGSMLPRVLVVLALVTCNTNAASLEASETRQQWQGITSAAGTRHLPRLRHEVLRHR